MKKGLREAGFHSSQSIIVRASVLVPDRLVAIAIELTEHPQPLVSVDFPFNGGAGWCGMCGACRHE